MCEHSSNNPAAALREARRRKILENSANRLKLIEGINSHSEKLSAEAFLEAKPDHKVQKPDDAPGSQSNSKFTDFIKTNKELKEISDFLLKDDPNANFEEADEDEVIDAGEVERQRFAYLNIFLQKRLHYIFLALTVNILLHCDAGNVFYENIFCPFYTLKAIELVSKRGEKEDFQPVLFIFLAGLPRSVQKFTKTILPFILAMMSDLCIYLFTFIIGTKIINKQN